jgi:archaellum biogenesis ATPase FlaH
LDYLAKCRQAFTPFAPIELPDFFAGRAHVVEDIRGELQAPGRQVAIYGERGVGKTSLALLLYFFADYDDENVRIYRCDEKTTFETICSSFLSKAGDSQSLDSIQIAENKEAGVRLGPLAVSDAKRSSHTFKPLPEIVQVSPARMLETFSSRRELLIIDEFDRVRDKETKTRIAELIKHFSDARSESKVVIVGVAETLTELIGQHESLSRSLAQIGLKRMDDPELAEIIKRGKTRIGVSFDDRVTKKIIRLADGFPHFVHLLCLYSSIYAGRVLKNGRERAPHVGDSEYKLGLQSAIEKSEHSLRDTYDTAIITTRKKSGIYELILHSLAMSDEIVVQVREIERFAEWLTGYPQKPEKFSNPLGQLIKSERGCILVKVRDGYYKFSNPLMRPYIRFKMEYDNITLHGGQLEFPFMCN